MYLILRHVNYSNVPHKLWRRKKNLRSRSWAHMSPTLNDSHAAEEVHEVKISRKSQPKDSLEMIETPTQTNGSDEISRGCVTYTWCLFYFQPLPFFLSFFLSTFSKSKGASVSLEPGLFAGHWHVRVPLLPHFNRACHGPHLSFLESRAPTKLKPFGAWSNPQPSFPESTLLF